MAMFFDYSSPESCLYQKQMDESATFGNRGLLVINFIVCLGVRNHWQPG